jgi:parallel beta-helix repeat protein
MNRKFVVLSVFVFVLLNTILSGTDIAVKTSVENMIAGGDPPIRIIGNDQFTSENGVSGGNGTVDDPYIIEDWVIVSDGSASQGIFINDTDAYFIIRNCTIQGFHDSEDYCQGIQLSEVTHGRTEITVVSESEIGIYLRYSPGNTIVNCTCSDYPYENGYGISIRYSANVSIVSCRCYNMYVGIFISESSGLTLQKTECSNNSGWGLLADVPNQDVLHYLIENCSFKGNGYEGVWLSGSIQNLSGSIFRNCSFHGNGRYGLFLERLSENIIENCVFDHNYNGIYLDRSGNNIIRNCSFLFQTTDGVNIAGTFIVLKFPRNNEISYCDFIGNHIGIFLFGTRITKIHHCIIANNTNIGVFCPFSIAQLTSCNIVGNGRNNSQFIDSAGVYSWGSFFFDVRQNWWGSSQGPSVSLMYNTGNYVFKIVPLRAIDNSDLVMLRYGVARFRPWSPVPVPDAGRQTKTII